MATFLATVRKSRGTLHIRRLLIDNVTLKILIQAMKRAILLNTVLNVINPSKLYLNKVVCV